MRLFAMLILIPQFMTIQDRRKSGFILSPTHEEEMTSLVSDMTNSYKDFPLRLYQICMYYGSCDSAYAYIKTSTQISRRIAAETGFAAY